MNRVASITKAEGFRSIIELRLELMGTLFWLLNKESNKLSTKGMKLKVN